MQYLKQINRSDLTIIIPFLNENEEVYNTVHNIRMTGGEAINIILINDASEDGYDYESVSKKFNATYINHDNRKGIAASRDEAILLSNTEYFLLLDAHMRFFQNDWPDILLKELKADKRALLCCKSIALEKTESGDIIKSPNRANSYGAYINFDDYEKLSVDWTLHDPDTQEEVIDIPCILGAGYACNKKYWLYLKGLEGLRSYGYDEQLISIKVWLEGGKCRLLKNIESGHIYRTTMPYETDSTDVVYNKLLIAELFFDYERKYNVFKNTQTTTNKEIFQSAMELLKKYNKDIAIQKNYNREIYTREISFDIDYNMQYVRKHL